VRTLMLMLFAVLFVVFGSSAPFSTGALAGPSAELPDGVCNIRILPIPTNGPDRYG